ncbi:hypothetical protein JYU34_017691 [Plutella xylostella]|uniref:Uncharacterized protein n=1 Tax=Plutella xylostella TaxID=51655 RepID=A0ABQ7Q1P1_PLUXY|nr:hypothetical protein JYU34_017691 [Plutella xylostella]
MAGPALFTPYKYSPFFCPHKLPSMAFSHLTGLIEEKSICSREPFIDVEATRRSRQAAVRSSGSIQEGYTIFTEK